MHERETAVQSARDLAESSRQRAQAATDEFDAKTRAARAELYGQMEDKRRAALAMRAELVAGTRREIEQTTADATARIRAQADEARRALERDADQLASTI